MTFLLLAALLVGPARADTGDTAIDCREAFPGIEPRSITAHTDSQRRFRVDFPDACREDWECVWTLDPGGGTLSDVSGFVTTWTAPPEPPADCDPDTYDLYVSCVYRGWRTETDHATITLRCTDEQWDELRAERERDISVAGGGCGSQRAGLLLLLPLGFGLGRRRSGKRG